MIVSVQMIMNNVLFKILLDCFIVFFFDIDVFLLLVMLYFFTQQQNFYTKIINLLFFLPKICKIYGENNLTDPHCKKEFDSKNNCWEHMFL